MEHDIPRMKKASSMVASAMAGSILPASQAISKPYTITSANSLPIIVLPPMQSSSSSSSSQPQVINVDLDGKRIGKCVTDYLNKEVHVQGGTRNR
jgi:hypothetical protein